MNILISPLGLAPGVVTGAYYALRDGGYGTMDKVITISTSHDQVRLCEREIAAEFERIEMETGATVKYEHRNLAVSEVRASDDVSAFSELIRKLLQECKSAGHDVYLNLTGGHKSMVAAAAMAAQLYQPAVTFHLYVDPEIERGGHISTLLKKFGSKRRYYLKPPPEKVTLVEIPLLPVGQEREDLWAALFEIRVAEHLARKYRYPEVRYNFYPPYLKAQNVGEVDIYLRDASASPRRVLVGECKLRVGDDPDTKPISVEEVNKLWRKVQHIREREEQAAHDFGTTLKLFAEVISNTTQADPEAKMAAQHHGIELITARLPGNWKRRADWKVISVQLIE